MSYIADLKDGRQLTAVRRRYAEDHPEFDPEIHWVQARQLEGGRVEIIGHEEMPEDARLGMCCCHPDLPRGHE